MSSIDDTFRSFRRFLHVVKTEKEDTRKVEILMEAVEDLETISLFQNVLKIILYKGLTRVAQQVELFIEEVKSKN